MTALPADVPHNGIHQRTIRLVRPQPEPETTPPSKPKAKPVPSRYVSPPPPTRLSELDAYIEKLKDRQAKIHEERQRERLKVKPIKMDDIIDACCYVTGVGVDDVRGRGRMGPTVLCREMIVLAARHFTTRSYPEIARAMGKKSHSGSVEMYHKCKPRLDSGGEEAVLQRRHGELCGLTYRQVWEQVCRAIREIHVLNNTPK